MQHRCKEKTTFRIVTSYDVHSDLDILKQQLDLRPQISTSDEFKKLVIKIKERFGGRFGGDVITPESGADVDFWIDNCLWDKRPDDIIQLENHNKILSEKVFKTKRVNVVPEHRDELYMKLLFLVKEASSKNISAFPGCYKILRSHLNIWFDQTLATLSNYNNSDNPLRDKMQDAGLPSPVVRTAEDLHWRYREARLDPDYYGGPTAFKRLEDEIMSLILKLQAHQYSQGDAFDSILFHKYCIEEVYRVTERDRLREFDLPEHIAAGFFYQVANRCLMRFTCQ